MSRDRNSQASPEEKFQQDAKKRIKVLLSPKAGSQKRIQAAKWLGECGLPETIKPLVQVYGAENQKASDDGELLKAVIFALGQYRAFEQAINAAPGERLDDALERNPKLLAQIDRIAQTGQFGKPKPMPGGVLWLIVLLLIGSLAVLGSMSVSKLTGSGEPTATPTPSLTPSPTETLPPGVTPSSTPTPTHTPTPTITPTATIAPDDIRPYVQELTDVIVNITQPRGSVELLRTFWRDVEGGGNTAGCNVDLPIIPDDVFIPDEYLNNVVGMRDVQQRTNLVLGSLRTAWEVFKTSCEDNTLSAHVTDAIAAVALIDNQIIALNSLLPALQAQAR